MAHRIKTNISFVSVLRFARFSLDIRMACRVAKPPSCRHGLDLLLFYFLNSLREIVAYTIGLGLGWRRNKTKK
jgi:hypothetical protein